MLFARQQTRSLADAEDVLQEAIVHLWSKRDVFQSIQPGLVFTQIRRFAIDKARKDQRRENREEQFASTESPWFEPDRNPFGDTELEAIIKRIAPEQQEVLVLKIWGDQTFESIGRSLDISPNTAASRYRYGLEQLRVELSGEGKR